MSLTSENRKSIIKTLQEWQRTGAFENFEEVVSDDDISFIEEHELLSEL